MTWIYFQESAASHLHLSHGLEQSPIVSETDLLRIKCLGNSVVPLQAREAFIKLTGLGSLGAD